METRKRGPQINSSQSIFAVFRPTQGSFTQTGIDFAGKQRALKLPPLASDRSHVTMSLASGLRSKRLPPLTLVRMNSDSTKTSEKKSSRSHDSLQCERMSHAQFEAMLSKYC